MPFTSSSLLAARNPLAAHYQRFDVANRLLLTGHSHQAWPDVAEPALLRAFADAATLVDHKWERAFAQAEHVRAGFARLLDDDHEAHGHITLTANTHDAVVRFLSALSLHKVASPRLLTSDGEFHTLRRQLARLEEEGVVVERVPSDPASDLVARMIAAMEHTRPSAVLVSSVLFGSGHIVPHLDELAAAAASLDVPLLLDTYHQLNVVPLSLRGPLASAFVVGGGYKYCQLGEGNCFLRAPAQCALRPLVTGWFAEFSLLAGAASDEVAYPDGPDRFAGATYDPTSHYRAAAVFDFFAREGLTPAVLRETSQAQLRHLSHGFDALDLDDAVISRAHDVPLAGLGGFVSLHSPHAAALASALGARGVLVDHRGTRLRLGPAPYTSLTQLDAALAALRDVVVSAPWL